MAADQRRLKKTFNVVLAGLIKQMMVIVPGNPTLKFFETELVKNSANPRADHIPAAHFFESMNAKTGIPSAADGSGDAVVGELVLLKDDRLFSDQCKAEIQTLKLLGLKSVWPKLSQENKDIMWGYLDRLARMSAKILITAQVESNPEVQNIAKAMKESKGSIPPLRPGATPKEYAEYAKKADAIIAKARSTNE